jgi:hypothetical protein
MEHAYHTRELAKAYETQGFYRQALDIYTVLDQNAQGSDTDIQAACRRLEPLAAEAEHEKRKTRLAVLLKDWFTLWRMKHHLTILDNLISLKRSRQ